MLSARRDGRNLDEPGLRRLLLTARQPQESVRYLLAPCCGGRITAAKALIEATCKPVLAELDEADDAAADIDLGCSAVERWPVPGAGRRGLALTSRPGVEQLICN